MVKYALKLAPTPRLKKRYMLLFLIEIYFTYPILIHRYLFQFNNICNLSFYVVTFI